MFDNCYIYGKLNYMVPEIKQLSLSDMMKLHKMDDVVETAAETDYSKPITISIASEMSGVSKQRINILIKTGRLTARRCGKVMWLIDAVSLGKLIDSIAAGEYKRGRPKKKLTHAERMQGYKNARESKT